MRPPNKSRSRNKNNRRNNNNGGGNVLNRVYDSAGPDGRVRGTPVQVIEKYQALAHDNSLAGDRVAMENFQQHAEHYIRLINEANRQIAERREQMEGQNRNSSDGDNAKNNNNHNGNRNSQQDSANARSDEAPKTDPSQSEQPDLAAPVAKRVDAPKAAETSPLSADGDVAPANGGLVDTPEDGSAKAKPSKPKRQRRPKPAAAAKEPEEAARPAE